MDAHREAAVASTVGVVMAAGALLAAHAAGLLGTLWRFWLGFWIGAARYAGPTEDWPEWWQWVCVGLGTIAGLGAILCGMTCLLGLILFRRNVLAGL